MIRKAKSYLRPWKLFESARIKEENVLVERYALKNKREIWKALAKITYFRHRAKVLAGLPLEEQEVLFRKLTSIGLKVDNIADVLSLGIENLLRRRLPTIVLNKGFAKTPKQARQMVVHKKILIDGKVVNVPGYIVRTDEEDKITLRASKPKVEKKAEQPKGESQ